MSRKRSGNIKDNDSDCLTKLRTERDRLAYLESIWRLAVDNVDQGAWDYNSETKTRFYSEGWRRIRGMKAGDEPYSTLEEWLLRIHPDDRALVSGRIEAHNAGRENEWEFSYRELSMDGRWVWILSRGRAVEFDDTGKPTRLLGTDIDITEIKERDIKYAAEERRTYEVHVASLRSAHAEAEEARQTAVRMANSDQLSELPNRRYFLQRLQEMVRGGDEAFGVIILDVDDFKKINDRHGHDAGDFVIYTTGSRLAERFPAPHVVARLGGDEFGVIVNLPAADASHCLEQQAAEICTIMKADIHREGVPFVTGCSIGAAMFPRDGTSVSQLLKSADLAVYRAKEEGKGRSVTFNSTLSWEAHQQALIENGLREAIASNAIIAHFQPVMDVTTGKVVMLEALARWECPKLGSLMPDVFLPVAEKLALLNDLTANIILQAGKLAEALPDDVCLSFNLTTAEVCDLATPLRISGLLKEAKLTASRVRFEVTEQALVRNLFNARQVIASLRAMGIKVFIDDFGAGFSGLCHLKDLQVDGLKFDKSFAQTLTSNPASRIILANMFELAKSLELETVVEGIESAATLDLVRGMGAVQCQGYHFARALAADKVASLFGLPQATTRRRRA